MRGRKIIWRLKPGIASFEVGPIWRLPAPSTTNTSCGDLIESGTTSSFASFGSVLLGHHVLHMCCSRACHTHHHKLPGWVAQCADVRQWAQQRLQGKWTQTRREKGLPYLYTIGSLQLEIFRNCWDFVPTGLTPKTKKKDFFLSLQTILNILFFMKKYVHYFGCTRLGVGNPPPQSSNNHMNWRDINPPSMYYVFQYISGHLPMQI